MKLQVAWIKWNNDFELRLVRAYALLVRCGDCTLYRAVKDLQPLMPKRTYSSIYHMLQKQKRIA